MQPNRAVPQRRPQLSEDAASYVRNMIMSGRLQPGAAVKAEAIGEQMGISATPVREALQALRVEGFLQLLPRKGFLVASLTGDDIRDIFTAHALLAGELAARAATAASDGDLAELQTLHAELLDAAARGEVDVLEAKNHAFHRTVSLTANAQKIAWALGLVARYVPALFYASIEGWPEATAHDHAEILDAIQSREPERARAAMHSHIVHAGELLAKQFDARTAMAAP
jgi:DNA-binding GntR family transcriptional regulator